MQKPSGIIIAALKSIPATELSLLFRSLRAEKLEQVMGAIDLAALQKIQTQALYIEELHQLFISMQDTPLSL
jgi:hypothetical protein